MLMTRSHLSAKRAVVQQQPQLGLALGQICREWELELQDRSLETAACSQWLLHLGHVSSMKERPRVRGIPQPRFVGLCCI